MYEDESELSELQGILDRTRAARGGHVDKLFEVGRWMSAGELSEYFLGIRQVALATLNARGQPRVAPADAVFLHSRFYLYIDERSLRAGRLRARPEVSLTSFGRREPLVISNGVASFVDRLSPAFEAADAEWRKVLGKSVLELEGEAPAFVKMEPETMIAYAWGAEAKG